MLAKLGCSWVIVGHSERRQYHGETDKLVAEKAAAALDNDISPIVCVGEPLAVREAGTHVDYVVNQTRNSLAGLSAEQLAKTVIAYEPVWAIGTGLTATPQQAQDVHAAIRAQLAAENSEVAQGVRLLYGGSVKAANAVELFGMPDIDGGLIGGASLNADEFGAICRAAGN